MKVEQLNVLWFSVGDEVGKECQVYPEKVAADRALGSGDTAKVQELMRDE